MWGLPVKLQMDVSPFRVYAGIAVSGKQPSISKHVLQRESRSKSQAEQSSKGRSTSAEMAYISQPLGFSRRDSNLGWKGIWGFGRARAPGLERGGALPSVLQDVHDVQLRLRVTGLKAHGWQGLIPGPCDAFAPVTFFAVSGQ